MLLKNISVFNSIIRNINSEKMNRGMIGYTLKNVYEPFGLEEIRDYADATCDDFSKYARSGAPAPPFFFSKELYPMFKQIITHRALNLNLLRMVHGYQRLRSYEPFRHENKLNVEMTITGITDTPAGELMMVKTAGSSDNKLILEAETGFIVRRKSSGTDRKSRREKYAPDNQPEKNEFRFLIQTVKGQEKKYAEVSNDTNPIHTSTIFARAAGLPGRILHGVCVIAMCTNGLIDGVLNKDHSRLREISGRFSYPVFPGETLIVAGNGIMKDGLKGVDFNVYSESGKTVINKGIFLYS